MYDFDVSEARDGRRGDSRHWGRMKHNPLSGGQTLIPTLKARAAMPRFWCR